MLLERQSRHARPESASLRLNPKRFGCKEDADDPADAVTLQDRYKRSGTQGLEPHFDLVQHPQDCFLRRTQLLSAFFEVHYPSRQDKTSLATRGSTLKLLPSIDVSHALLGPAIEAVCLSFFAQRMNDTSLAHYARALYGQTLASLNRAITGRRYAPSDVVRAIILITLYREGPSAVKQESHSWTAHYLGATTYIASQNPSQFDMTSELDRSIFRTLR